MAGPESYTLRPDDLDFGTQGAPQFAEQPKSISDLLGDFMEWQRGKTFTELQRTPGDLFSDPKWAPLAQWADENVRSGPLDEPVGFAKDLATWGIHAPLNIARAGAKFVDNIPGLDLESYSPAGKTPTRSSGRRKP